MVGWAEPPAGSTVTATTAPFFTLPWIGTNVEPPPREEAGGHGRALAADHPRLVGLPGRGGVEAVQDERGRPVARDDERAGRPCDGHALERLGVREPVVERDVPDPEADRGTGCDRGDGGDAGTSRRGRSGTTFGRSARAATRIRSRRTGGGAAGPRRVGERLRGRRERGDLLAAALAAREVLLVGLALARRRARRARRPRSGRGCSRCPWISVGGCVEQLAQPGEAREHSTLDGA